MIQQEKKGQEKMIAMLIIMAIGFVLVAFIVFRIGQAAHEEAGPQACLGALTAQNWVIEKLRDVSEDVYGVRPGGLTSAAKPWPRACRTQDRTIEGEAAPQASQEIIRLLGDCWYQMGSGRFSPFDADWLGPGKKCFICYTFRAPNLQEPITDVQFNSYLKEISYPGSDQNLYATFNRDMTHIVGRGREDNIELLSDDISSDRFYAIVFFDIASDVFARMAPDWVFAEQDPSRPERGASKLYIAPVERARECYISGEEAETGD